MIERKKLLENLLRLRSRIEDWCEVNGYENMDNQAERKFESNEIVWKRTDWEFVDSMYGAVYNGPRGFGNDYSFNNDTIKTWNRLWKRYKVDTTITNYNLESEWEQLQQMDWDDSEMKIIKKTS